MERNRKNFLKHDKERFTQYLQEVAKSNKKIASGPMKPHEIVKMMLPTSKTNGATQSRAEPIDVAELQWESYVQDLKKSGRLSRTLAVCDVSGSMEGDSKYAAIALALLTAAVTDEPFDK